MRSEQCVRAQEGKRGLELCGGGCLHQAFGLVPTQASPFLPSFTKLVLQKLHSLVSHKPWKLTHLFDYSCAKGHPDAPFLTQCTDMVLK